MSITIERQLFCKYKVTGNMNIVIAKQLFCIEAIDTETGESMRFDDLTSKGREAEEARRGVPKGTELFYDDLTQVERAKVRAWCAEIQGNKCWKCQYDLGKPGKPGKPAPEEQIKEYIPDRFPEGFLNYQIHLHHDHKTGRIIGAVHAKCNANLWIYEGQ